MFLPQARRVWEQRISAKWEAYWAVRKPKVEDTHAACCRSPTGTPISGRREGPTFLTMEEEKNYHRHNRSGDTFHKTEEEKGQEKGERREETAVVTAAVTCHDCCCCWCSARGDMKTSQQRSWESLTPSKAAVAADMGPAPEQTSNRQMTPPYDPSEGSAPKRSTLKRSTSTTSTSTSTLDPKVPSPSPGSFVEPTSAPCSSAGADGRRSERGGGGCDGSSNDGRRDITTQSVETFFYQQPTGSAVFNSQQQHSTKERKANTRLGRSRDDRVGNEILTVTTAAATSAVTAGNSANGLSPWRPPTFAVSALSLSRPDPGEEVNDQDSRSIGSRCVVDGYGNRVGGCDDRRNVLSSATDRGGGTLSGKQQSGKTSGSPRPEYSSRRRRGNSDLGTSTSVSPSQHLHTSATAESRYRQATTTAAIDLLTGSSPSATKQLAGRRRQQQRQQISNLHQKEEEEEKQRRFRTNTEHRFVSADLNETSISAWGADDYHFQGEEEAEGEKEDEKEGARFATAADVAAAGAFATKQPVPIKLRSPVSHSSHRRHRQQEGQLQQKKEQQQQHLYHHRHQRDHRDHHHHEQPPSPLSSLSFATDITPMPRSGWCSLSGQADPNPVISPSSSAAAVAAAAAAVATASDYASEGPASIWPQLRSLSSCTTVSASPSGSVESQQRRWRRQSLATAAHRRAGSSVWSSSSCSSGSSSSPSSTPGSSRYPPGEGSSSSEGGDRRCQHRRHRLPSRFGDNFGPARGGTHSWSSDPPTREANDGKRKHNRRYYYCSRFQR